MDTPGIQNRLGVLFFLIIYLALMSLSSLPLWHDERLLFVRERAAGAYGTTSYFIANILFDVLPMRVLPPCFFALVSYWMVGLRASIGKISPFDVLNDLFLLAAMFRFMIVVVLCNVAASTFSLAIGAMLNSTSVANMVASLCLLMETLLGGMFLGRKQGVQGLSIVLDSISRLSFIRYAFEGLLINEFHKHDGFRLTASHRCIPGNDISFEVTGDEILDTLGFPSSWKVFWIDVLLLIVFICIHCVVIYLLFKYRDRPGEPSLWNKIYHRCKNPFKNATNDTTMPSVSSSNSSTMLV